MTKLTIIRGVPGTGKSTLAAKMKDDNTVILEADMYFTRDTGNYEFSVDLLGRAHFWCTDTTKVLLRQGHNVIVANTFTTWKELLPYIAFTSKNDIPIEVITLEKEYGSIHDVPNEAMIRMRSRFLPHTEVMQKISDLGKT